jgi:hypothetical protein
MPTLSNYLIPLVNIPQTFSVNLAGINYTMTVKWCDIGQSWILDLADASQNVLAAGLPFITGADLLDGLAYLGVQGSLFSYTNGLPFAVPTLDNLGSDANLYFQTSVANNGD